LVLMLHWIVMIGCTAAASLVLLTADVGWGFWRGSSLSRRAVGGT
jgi:hypothetical protein